MEDGSGIEPLYGDLKSSTTQFSASAPWLADAETEPTTVIARYGRNDARYGCSFGVRGLACHSRKAASAIRYTGW